MNALFGKVTTTIIGGIVLSTLTWAQAPLDTNATRTTSAGAITLLHGGEMGELLSVYVPRDNGEIQRLLDAARDLQRAADSEIDGTLRLAAEADGRARVMKEEIETTKVRRDVAKKAKDEAARAELAATVKRQTREREYFEHLRDAMRADADRLQAEREASAARVEALELEADVAGKYVDLGFGSPPLAAVKEYRSLLRQMLEAQKQSAHRWQDASMKRERVAERRLKQLELLSKMSQ